MEDKDILAADVTETEQERHTDEIQDIITKVPSWVIRWGIMVFFFVLLVVVGISAIVHYPDTVKSRITFQPAEKDAVISSPTAAIIKQVAITQNAVVSQGQLLAIVIDENNQEQKLTAPIAGKVGFAAITQTGTPLQAQQSLFVIHPVNQHFFGVIHLPAIIASDLKKGQQVLVSIGKSGLAGGQIRGTVTAITDEPDKTGLITVTVALNNSDQLKSWMTGDAEIMTKDISVFTRIWAGMHTNLSAVSR